MKKQVLELGGADPFIVCHDADLDLAAAKGVDSRLKNGGQSCNNAKRFLIHESVYEEFKKKVIEHLSKFKVGDPFDASSSMGPLCKF